MLLEFSTPKVVSTLICLLFYITFTYASDTLIQKSLQLTQSKAAIILDGRMNETEWATAVTASNFIQILPEHGAKANLNTNVKLIHHEDYLYVGIFCFDSSQLFYSIGRRDFNHNSQDCFGMVIDGFGDNRVAMSFIVNPGGAQKDMMVFDDIHFDEEWDGVWMVRTSISDSGWYAEIAIPWETLRFKKENQDWKINFFRRSSGKNELSAWSIFPRFASPFRLQFAGSLKIVPPKQRLNIRFQPYLLSYNSKSKSNSFKTADQQLKTGGDIKWAISPKDVLDFTVNTDFAQADVDRRIVNLSRSSIFLPERRPFFLENSAFFSEGLKANGPLGTLMQVIPFLSRRIGLDEKGNTLPIRQGGRFVHRSAQTNYGALLLQQEEQEGNRSLFVGRLTQNFGKQNRIGFIQTSNFYKQNASSTTSADAFFRIGASHEIKTMISSSYDNNQQNGLSQYIQYDYKSEKLVSNIRQSYVSSGYNPSLGFVSRNDVINFSPNAFFTLKPKKKNSKILFYEPGLFLDIFYQPSQKKLQEYQIIVNPAWINFKNASAFGVLFNLYYQDLANDFSPAKITIKKGKYKYQTIGFVYNTSPFKVLTLSNYLEYGGFYNGQLLSHQSSIMIRPGAQLTYRGEIQNYLFKDLGEKRETKSMHLTIHELRYAFTPRIILSGFYQYDFFSKESGANIRCAWEFKPLSFLYIIYNRNTKESPTLNYHQQGLIIKASYIHQL